MNISAYTCILTVLLMTSQVNCSCQLDDQCSTYCYQVVKPLLQYVNTVSTMTQENNELQHTVKRQAKTIENLNELIKEKIQLNDSYQNNNANQQRRINQYKMQNDFVNDSVTSQILNNLNQQEFRSKLNQLLESHSQNERKLLDQYEMQITNLKSEIKSKDEEIKELQSQNAKTEPLQNNITAYKQSSSCFGKSTAVHTIRVPITMTVSCESKLPGAGTGWTVIQRRKDGSVNFNKNWLEYKNGFGDLRGEFFIGLEKLHLLTQSQPHELYISLGDFSNETRYARYDNFLIGNETDLYRIIELGTYSGDAGDSLEGHTYYRFSTPDKDSTYKKCASYFSSGWWFVDNGCYSCNLNGQYVEEDIAEETDGIEWREWKMDQLLKFTQMMIRPISESIAFN
ncbi:fibrinogen-like protein 1 [Drosophila nasuta]|uniref:fibrinogen-like protein 1 n=1 Tax=Drosophila nasuta TaxID=42062 RepID=UPI00295F17E4|nr:fibrinogen-like protein 1 [Drosophila nasuta]